MKHHLISWAARLRMPNGLQPVGCRLRSSSTVPKKVTYWPGQGSVTPRDGKPARPTESRWQVHSPLWRCTRLILTAYAGIRKAGCSGLCKIPQSKLRARQTAPRWGMGSAGSFPRQRIDCRLIHPLNTILSSSNSAVVASQMALICFPADACGGSGIRS